MKIALIGYGKMGKTIEKIALERGHEISARVDANPDEWNQFYENKHDAAIEFSIPSIAPSNIVKCLDYGVAVLCGTTGWLADKLSVEEHCSKIGGTFFYASNFSLGVNIFFKLNEYLAKLINPYDQYDISMLEIHHTQKKDAPSGTAISLAEGILKNLGRKQNWTQQKDASSSEIFIESQRIDPYPGLHSIKYQSPIDEIEIRHTAHSREGFALGAVLVAEWIQGKKGILNMDDFLKF